MSFAHLRDGPLAARYSDKVSSLRRRSSRLRALNSVTAALTQHVGLPSALGLDFDAVPPPPPHSDQEAKFIDDNDLAKGRYFNPDSLHVTLDALLPSTQTQKEHNVLSGEPDSAADDKSAIGNASPASPTETQTLPAIEEYPDAALANSELRLDARSHAKRAALDLSELNQTHQVHHDNDTLMTGLDPDVDTVSLASSGAGALSPTTAAPAGPSSNTSADEENGSEENKARPVDAVAVALEEDSETMSDGDDVQDLTTNGPRSPDEHLRSHLEQRTGTPSKKISHHVSPKHRSPEIDEQQTGQSASIPSEHGAASMVTDQVHAVADDLNAATPVRRDVSEIGIVRASLLGKEDAPLSLAVVASPRRITARDDGALGKISTPSRARVSVDERPPPGRLETLTRSNSRSSQDKKLPKLPPDLSVGYKALKGAADDPRRDYLEPLYRFQAQDLLNGKSVGELLHRATKVVDTGDQLAGVRERLDHRVLKRIYALQCNNKWSLRQPEPCPEPAPVKSHIDHLLSEMKWMRADFRSERKLKRSLAKFLAVQCADWVCANAARRQQLQINCTTIRKSRDALLPAVHRSGNDRPHTPANTKLGVADVQISVNDNPPDIAPSTRTVGSPSNDADMPLTPIFAVVPESLLEVTKLSEPSLDRPQADHILEAINNLPLFMPFDNTATTTDPYEIVRAPIASLSKFSDTKVLADICEPNKKRSRYDFEQEDSHSDAGLPERATKLVRNNVLPPEQADIALFNPEFQHIKDRLHSNTVFRPPSEHLMPATQFYEFRSASQWTLEDDQKLKELAKDYCFNWSLVAADMALPSNLHGAADRRTPWECFERWVELESLPNEMKKTVYFRTWGQRLETASRNVDARYQAQLQAQSQNNSQAPVPMRRKIQPMRVDKRRSSRHLHMIDAMRKLARKREQQLHKQTEALKAASLRKQQESVQPRAAMHTPQEFSRIRHDRDVQLAARQEKYREQMIAQQKAAQMHRNGQYANHQQAMAAAQQQQRATLSTGQQLQPGQPGVHPGFSNAHPGQPMADPSGQRTEHLAVPHMGAAQVRPRPGMPGTPRQGVYAGQEYVDGVPHSQMYGRPKSAQRVGHAFAMAQQQQQRPNMNGAHAANGMMNNQQAMAVPMQSSHSNGGQAPMMQRNLSGHSNAASSQGASASPLMRPPPIPGPQTSQLSSGLVPAIAQLKHSLQAAHPQATLMQIEQMASDQLKRLSAQRQSAMNAASGGHVPGIGQPGGAYPQPAAVFSHNSGMPFQQPNGLGNASTPQQQHQYAALMRQRQLLQQQQQAQQMQQQAQGNNAGASGATSSPRLQQANLNHAALGTHASPNMAQAVPNMLGMNINGSQQQAQQQRPMSRSGTPQMVRVGSSSGMGIGSPGKTAVKVQNMAQHSQQQGQQQQQQSLQPARAQQT